MTLEEMQEQDRKSGEELTTLMHAELMEGEMNQFEMRVFGAYGAMNRGLSKEDALRKYDLSEKEYDDNIDRVMKL
ncbi:MAG: hypothetical protein LUD72_10415 [Bacteroidales bacterium]|nr:hypothetical protein [Bacteroidales bacterium]